MRVHSCRGSLSSGVAVLSLVPTLVVAVAVPVVGSLSASWLFRLMMMKVFSPAGFISQSCASFCWSLASWYILCFGVHKMVIEVVGLKFGRWFNGFPFEERLLQVGAVVGDELLHVGHILFVAGVEHHFVIDAPVDAPFLVVELLRLFEHPCQAVAFVV